MRCNQAALLAKHRRRSRVPLDSAVQHCGTAHPCVFRYARIVAARHHQPALRARAGRERVPVDDLVQAANGQPDVFLALKAVEGEQRVTAIEPVYQLVLKRCIEQLVDDKSGWIGGTRDAERPGPPIKLVACVVARADSRRGTAG